MSNQLPLPGVLADTPRASRIQLSTLGDILLSAEQPRRVAALADQVDQLPATSANLRQDVVTTRDAGPDTHAGPHQEGQ